MTNTTASAVKREVVHSGGKPEYRGFRTMSLAEYHAALAKAWGDDPKHWRFVCPSCGVTQSIADFIEARPDVDPNVLARSVGFSCIGRWTGAEGAFNREKFAPCNYTSGGLFCINALVVVMDDGEQVPAFEPAPAQPNRNATATDPGTTKGDPPERTAQVEHSV